MSYELLDVQPLNNDMYLMRVLDKPSMFGKLLGKKALEYEFVGTGIIWHHCGSWDRPTLLTEIALSKLFNKWQFEMSPYPRLYEDEL